MKKSNTGKRRDVFGIHPAFQNKVKIWEKHWESKSSAPQKMGWDISHLSPEEKDEVVSFLQNRYGLTLSGRYAEERGLVVNIYSGHFWLAANYTRSFTANMFSSQVCRSLEEMTSHLSTQLDDWLL